MANLFSRKFVNFPQNEDLGQTFWKLVETQLQGSLEILKFFQAAVERDPEYPLAYTGLALNYVALATTTSNRQEFTDKALAAANKAVGLDAELDEAHNALGWVKYLG